MATTIIRGITNLIWGIPSEIKPVLNAPAGRMRLRFRNKDVGRLFVLTPEGIRHFHIKVVGDHWEPGAELGRNFRPQPESVNYEIVN